MDEKERAILRQMYELHLQLHEQQGEQLEALEKATSSLRKSHEILGRLLTLTGQLSGFA